MDSLVLTEYYYERPEFIFLGLKVFEVKESLRHRKVYGKNKTFSRLTHLCQKPVGQCRDIYIATLRYKINDPTENGSDFTTACSLPNTTMDFISQDSNSV